MRVHCYFFFFFFEEPVLRVGLAPPLINQTYLHRGSLLTKNLLAKDDYENKTGEILQSAEKLILLLKQELSLTNKHPAICE